MCLQSVRWNLRTGASTLLCMVSDVGVTKDVVSPKGVKTPSVGIAPKEGAIVIASDVLDRGRGRRLL